MKFDEKTGEILDRLGRRLDPDGREIPDPIPMAPPVGFKRQPPLHELIREMVRSERLAQEAAQMDAGSFEEEDDFDVDDETDPSSPWEENFDPLAGAPPELRGEGQSPSQTEAAPPPPAEPNSSEAQ